MTTVTLSKSIIIDASAHKVFDAIADWEHQSAWMLVTAVKGIKNEGRGVGATLSARTSLGIRFVYSSIDSKKHNVRQ